jgi:trimeric autotransporter adhesin
MANTKAFKVKNGLELGAISDTISDTAVDVLVYDTSKDSDGGAWRKRTQGTSWYNETLNTATRGSRKEFPAVAVIVAEITTITIYDGDDPDLPMWMVFSANGSTYSGLRYQGRGTNAITAVNGILYTANGTTDGVYYADFLKDHTWRIHTSNWYGPVAKTLAGRNEAIPVSEVPVQTREGLVHFNANDIASTVLPNAPIDAATGLPVPTIAVATDGGVSVIKDDGTVVDVTTTYNTDNTSDYIDFTSDNRLYFCSRGKNYPVVADIPSSDVSSVQSSDVIFWPSVAGTTSGLDQVTVNNTNVTDIAAATDNSISFGGPKGIIYAQNVENISADKTAVFAQITSDFNTGYQNGDIKLATLSDTDDTDVTGSELVTNGTFDSDTSGWTASALTTSVASGQATLTMTSTYGTFVQGITTVVGKTYTITCDIVSETVSGALYLGAGTTSGGSQLGLSTTSVGSNAFTFTATGTTTYVALYFNGASSQAAVIDNFTARLAEEDRSVNGNGLQVFGTVTKNPVATGADLVAYSGWSTSNYLEQPYNADLQFGTGDFVIMSWIKKTSGSTQGVIVDTRSAASSNAGLSVEVLSNQTLRLRTRNSSSEALTVTTGVVPTNTWTHFACVVSASGTNHKIYLNGKLDVSASVAAYSVDSSSPLWIGGAIGYSDVPLSDGSLALLRISATAPSPEQIAKIYEDEKVLFQENAQATLYGSSDAVTALAYDDTTELLHVGTSAGRSVFQGLRRVENTTTAVGTAISASNSLVVEE